MAHFRWVGHEDYSRFSAPPIFIHHKAKYFQQNIELNFDNFCLFAYVRARKENKKLTIIIFLCLTIAKKSLNNFENVFAFTSPRECSAFGDHPLSCAPRYRVFSVTVASIVGTNWWSDGSESSALGWQQDRAAGQSSRTQG